MGFSAGSYAKIKRVVETKEKFTKAQIVISAKDKKSGKYACVFSGVCSFVGKAHLCKPMEGQKIQIKNCDVTTGYLDGNGEQKWNDKPSFVIYEYELQGGASAAPTPAPSWSEIADDDSLPF